MPSSQNKPSGKNIKVLARSRTPFNDIFVIQDGPRREMWFNGDGKFFLQSRIDSDHPHLPALVYSKMILAVLLFHPRPQRVLIIGLGGGALSNCLHHWFPESHIDVAEIDPKVIALSRKYFGVGEDPCYQVVQEDGRVFVQKQQQAGVKYDIIFLDAFKSGSIPYHLKTVEFYRELRSVLTKEGVVASNLYGKSNKLKPSDRATFLDVFKQMYLFEDKERIATVSIATQQEARWPRDQFERMATAFPSPANMEFSMEEAVQGLVEPEPLPPEAKVFYDDFKKEEFDRAIEEHNRQRSGKRRYPINNVS